MTLRAASHLMGYLLGKNYLGIYNDALRAKRLGSDIDRKRAYEIREKLNQCGWLL